MKSLTTLRFRGVTARLLLVALAPFALDGCLSIDVDRTRAKTAVADARGSLEARLYETKKDFKSDVKSRREVTWKLFHLDASPEIPVREGTGTVWSATDLKAGEYRIAASWGPKSDVPGDASAGTGDDTFSLAPGDTARVDVILKKLPVWAVVALVLTVVGVVAVVVSLAAVGNSLKGINLSSGNTPKVDSRQQETPKPRSDAAASPEE